MNLTPADIKTAFEKNAQKVFSKKSLMTDEPSFHNDANNPFWTANLLESSNRENKRITAMFCGRGIEYSKSE